MEASKSSRCRLPLQPPTVGSGSPCRRSRRDQSGRECRFASWTVCGQLADGLCDECFDLGGGNADDRSRFTLVALQSRLRDVIAPALGPLPRPGRAHPVAPIVEKLSREQSFGGLARSLRPRGCQMIAQALLNPIPKVLIDDRRMLAFVDLAFVGD